MLPVQFFNGLAPGGGLGSVANIWQILVLFQMYAITRILVSGMVPTNETTISGLEFCKIWNIGAFSILRI